ncbi:MAG TPA: hypothetical protein VFU89_00885 [Rhabdochlamydiaceae bacterium]|nr:hypothetical protein [Rhabdochlamydiaceae bacterium]
MPINIPSIHQTQTLPIPPIIVTIWSGVKDRVVAVITRMPVLAGMAAIGGFVFGASTVGCIDYFFQNKIPELAAAWSDSNDHNHMVRGQPLWDINKPSTADKNLESRLKTIFAITIAALLFSIGMALAAWQAYGTSSDFTFISLAIGGVGFTLGAQFFENYKRNNPHQKQKFIQWLRQIDGNVDLRYQLDLSYYCDHLRYFNLMQQGREFHRTFRRNNDPCHTLVLQGCRLTDTDLKSLKEGEWFSLFPHVDISDNPQLTAAGLKWVGEGGAEKLTRLDLSRMNLTDDHLMQMAATGHFNNLEELIIRDNPLVTGKGLARIGQSGFEKLKMLDIGGNSQVLGKGLDEWIGKGGFKNLKALGLGYTTIIESDLQQMIDKEMWFKNLEGLDLDDSVKLKRFPANISQMTRLRTRPSSLDGYRPFDSQGICFRNYGDDFEFTPEFSDICKAGKATINIKNVKTIAQQS